MESKLTKIWPGTFGLREIDATLYSSSTVYKRVKNMLSLINFHVKSFRQVALGSSGLIVPEGGYLLVQSNHHVARIHPSSLWTQCGKIQAPLLYWRAGPYPSKPVLKFDVISITKSTMQLGELDSWVSPSSHLRTAAHPDRYSVGILRQPASQYFPCGKTQWDPED